MNFKVGDVVKYVGTESYKHHFYEYSVVSIVDDSYGIYLGMKCRHFRKDIANGSYANWRADAFQKVENPEKLPCYKLLLLIGHSREVEW